MIIRPSQLCWAGFIVMLIRGSVCVFMCLLAKSQKVFSQSTLFFGGSLRYPGEEVFRFEQRLGGKCSSVYNS